MTGLLTIPVLPLDLSSLLGSILLRGLYIYYFHDLPCDITLSVLLSVLST